MMMTTSAKKPCRLLTRQFGRAERFPDQFRRFNKAELLAQAAPDDDDADTVTVPADTGRRKKAGQSAARPPRQRGLAGPGHGQQVPRWPAAVPPGEDGGPIRPRPDAGPARWLIQASQVLRPLVNLLNDALFS